MAEVAQTCTTVMGRLPRCNRKQLKILEERGNRPSPEGRCRQLAAILVDDPEMYGNSDLDRIRLSSIVWRAPPKKTKPAAIRLNERSLQAQLPASPSMKESYIARPPETGIPLRGQAERRRTAGKWGPAVTSAVGFALLTASLNAAEPYFIDLSPVANTAMETDGQEGWSNEGINDMFVCPPIPSGEIVRNGYRFKLPDLHAGRTVLMLKGKFLPDKPQEAKVLVPEIKGRFVYFLQNSVRGVGGQPQNYRVALYTVGYADGTKTEIPIHDGAEIRPWWTGQWYDNSGAKSWPIFMGSNAMSAKWKQYVGVWAMEWSNPSPAKSITSITFGSDGFAAPAIFAVTIADEDYFQSAHIKDDFKRPADAPADYFEGKMAHQQGMLFQELRKQKMAEGVRRVELIRPDLIAVTIDAAVAGGAGLADAKAAALQKVGAFAITSDTDAAYTTSKSPLKVARQSYEYWNGDVGAFPQNQLYWHTYYLFLPSALKSGHTYVTTVMGLPADVGAQLSFAYDEQRTITPALKVNQVAYASLAERRYAYLGWWAGDAGKVDFADLRKFVVIDETSNRPVLEGALTLRAADDKLSGEQVQELDLSPLKPGRYHVLVQGLARSDSFSVGGDGIRELYRETNRAFFHQRCGQELGAPYSDFVKPACHTQVYESGHLVGAADYTPLPGEAVRSFRGGYHDAADFDVFTYHLRATAQVLTAFAFAPAKFKDGDLNIPESGNGIPDVLDEAEWALLGYRETQQADGGVPLGRGNDEDAVRDWERAHDGKRPPFGLFPPQSTSCTEYAAVAAQYARLIRPYDAAKADGYVLSARRAFAWAEAHPDTGGLEGGSDLFMAWAAAELYGTTGDEAFHATFKRLYQADALKNIHWKLQRIAPICLWAYIDCRQPGVDPAIRQALRAELIERADAIVKETDLPTYRVGRGPADNGNGWGNLNGGGHWADPCLRAYILTSDRKYLTAACLNADFQLGANPLSKTFITGLGARPPEHPQISEFLYARPNRTGSTVKGITVYGLTSDEPKWYPGVPPWRRWRDLGSGGAEVSSEFTITETIGASAMLYSVLLALEGQEVSH